MDTDDYFCICEAGHIRRLGNHGDNESAEAVAKSLGLDIIYLFGRDQAIKWRDTLNRLLPEVA